MKKRGLFYFLVLAVTFSFAGRTLVSQKLLMLLKQDQKRPNLLYTIRMEKYLN
jgi:hypothetical protein